MKGRAILFRRAEMTGSIANMFPRLDRRDGCLEVHRLSQELREFSSAMDTVEPEH